MTPTVNRHGILVLVSASLLSFLLGSVHAFSVFLEPLEQQFQASRTEVSLTYSLALISLTFAVLTGHRVFGRWPPGRLVPAICLLAAAGALTAAYGASLYWVWLGYSLLFGTANGLGYGFGLQISAQANPGREGLSMGIVTACYALGATVTPLIFVRALELGGFHAAMLLLAAALVVAAPVCSVLMSAARAKYQTAAALGKSTSVAKPLILCLWFGYGAGVAAGLMAIGHAVGIAKTYGVTGSGWLTPTVVAACNLCGSLIAGWLADRIPSLRLLILLPLISAAALIGLQIAALPAIAIFSLGLVGFVYGATISVYPAAIAKISGPEESARIYGRVFTAWGLAGLLAPWFAGFLFDWQGDYNIALAAAAAAGLLSAATNGFLYLSTGAWSGPVQRS